MQSSFFVKLRKEVIAIETQFMSFARRTTGYYNKSELLHCRAYISFCHSEVETYLECIAGRQIDLAERRWLQKGTTNRVLLSLLCYSNEKRSIGENIFEQGSKNTLANAVNEAIRMQRQAISKNNGIRRRNFSQLFVPIGIIENDVEELLVTELDNLGRHRGGLVHDTNGVSIERIRDPFTEEKKTIDNIISELAIFDLKFGKRLTPPR